MTMRKTLSWGCVSLGVLALAQATRAQDRSLDVPFVPTPDEVVTQMLETAKVNERDVLYDLGSGDGRMVITAARKHGARGVGVDLDPQRIAEARENAREAGVTQQVQFRQGDLFEVDLSPATVLTLYLLPEVNVKLRPQILQQLRPGARVVSHDFTMGEWEPDATEKVGHHTVYLWVVPARVAGEWRWTVPDAGAYTLDLDQQYQMINGRASNEKGPVSLSDPKLNGADLSFTATETVADRPVVMRYRGTVDGQRVNGTVEVQDGGRVSRHPWRATRR